MGWRERYEEKKRTAQEAVKEVRSNDCVFIGANVSYTFPLMQALHERRDELENVTLSCSLLYRDCDLFSTKYRTPFRSASCFLGNVDRAYCDAGLGDYYPVHLGDFGYYAKHIVPADVAFLEATRPNEQGYMSYGVSSSAWSDEVRSTARCVIVQANDRAPFVHGAHNLIHVDEADIIVETSMEYDVIPSIPVTETEQKIADCIIDQVPDGATIQLGIGGIPNAVGFGLDKKNDLGVHTELLTESIMVLAKKGVITGRKKNLHYGKIVTAFVMGTREVYDFLDHNPCIYAAPFSYVNDSYVIGQNDNLYSVNNAMMVDLFGQVYSEAVNYRQYSGTGGQLNFVRGAQISKGGKSFIVLNSTLEGKGKPERQSKIVLAPPPGTPVTTPRTDVQHVVTEYGCVNLKHLSVKGRAHALISLAHPDFRKELTKQAKDVGLI